jgi:hypothetical protein
MITPKIAANQAFARLNRVHKHDDQQRHPGAGEGKKSTSAEDAIDGVRAEISTFSTHPIQQFNTEFNAVVKSIRIADQAMGEIGANIEQMESEIQMFVKQYPPYPPGSEERSELLNHFAALRKQIDRLTFPPDPLAQQIIGQAGDGINASAGDIKIGKNDSYPAIRRQPVHTGTEGLNLPDLPADASDKAIAAMQGALSSARKVVTERRGQLADDVIQVIRRAEKTG